MAPQEQKRTQQPDEQETVEEEAGTPSPPAASPEASAATEGTDDLLDEIDGVLEVNAEEFVRGFVQKGGQ